MSKKLIVKCPTCKILVERDNEFFPFCSERCKTTDLGNWASGSYRIQEKSELDDDSQVFH